MRSDDFDARMRRYETANDFIALPGVYLVARLDGRRFTKLTKQTYDFETPFDEGFRDYMVATARHVMSAGFRVLYAHTQSDEISLLFNHDDELFDRKLRKLHSILAAESSASFSLALGGIASFDCRVSQLPTQELVIDYFRWRQADASRNALNAHCYWLLRKAGKTVNEASTALLGQSSKAKTALLEEHGVHFSRVPNWQKRGVGLYYAEVAREGHNPKTGEITKVLRRQIQVELDLPVKSAYGRLPAPAAPGGSIIPSACLLNPTDGWPNTMTSSSKSFAPQLTWRAAAF